jgi:NitT/TauT family transport system substrate-binding protein
MMTFVASLTRRTLVACAALVTGAFALPAAAQTPIKFQLDWRFEGPAALFLGAEAKGYYKANGLNVTIDAGNGSGGTVTRVASGVYDMGFADLAALMEFHANNPDAPNKPVAVMMVYNNTPPSRPTWRARSSAHRCLTPVVAPSRSSPRPTAWGKSPG